MPEYRDFREMIAKTTEKHDGSVVYSYRARPHDNMVTKVTYREFASHVRQIGTKAIDKSLSSKHVALIGKLSYSWVSVYFSMLAVGAVLVPLDPDWTADDLASTILSAECEVVFYTEAINAKLDVLKEKSGAKEFICLDGDGEGTLSSFRKAGAELLMLGVNSYDVTPVDTNALSLLVFTSGTTGKGKGVMLSQKAILSNIHGAFSILKIGKKTLGVLPPHHTYGSTISILSAYQNGSETYISSGMKYLLSELKEQKPDYLILVPLYLETFYRRIWATAKKNGKENLLRGMIKVTGTLKNVGVDVRHSLYAKTVLSAFGGELRMIVCGGAPLSQEIINSFEELGIRVLNGYGITECSPLISANRLIYSKDNSVGVPIPDEDVMIDNPNEDGEGEICIRGPHVMMGYFKDDDATNAVIDESGFFHTGDIGKYEDDVIYVTGRVKNLIILSNGKNVYPEEIESELLTVPGVSEIVVYEGKSRRSDKPDMIVAEIFPDKAYLEENGIDDAGAYFTKFVSDYNRRAVPYKKVERVKIRNEEFPKNTLRKIMRFKIDKSID